MSEREFELQSKAEMEEILWRTVIGERGYKMMQVPEIEAGLEQEYGELLNGLVSQETFNLLRLLVSGEPSEFTLMERRSVSHADLEGTDFVSGRELVSSAVGCKVVLLRSKGKDRLLLLRRYENEGGANSFADLVSVDLDVRHGLSGKVISVAEEKMSFGSGHSNPLLDAETRAVTSSGEGKEGVSRRFLLSVLTEMLGVLDKGESYQNRHDRSVLQRAFDIEVEAMAEELVEMEREKQRKILRLGGGVGVLVTGIALALASVYCDGCVERAVERLPDGVIDLLE